MTADQVDRGTCFLTDRHKYITWGRERQEFYDLAEDPDEMRNAIDDPAYNTKIGPHKDVMLGRLTRSDQHYYRDETPSDRDLQIWLQ